jgi:hypothetical protein
MAADVVRARYYRSGEEGRNPDAPAEVIRADRRAVALAVLDELDRLRDLYADVDEALESIRSRIARGEFP